MILNIHLADGSVVSLHGVEDYSFSMEDSTVNFYHEDTTLSVMPRERVMLIKELPPQTAPETETQH